MRNIATIIVSLSFVVIVSINACDYRENVISVNQLDAPTPAVVKTSSETKKPTEPQETLLSETENAYNPIPNPDGSLIAYVRTGWGREGGSGGFGRSNLVSEISVMDMNGNVQTKQFLADAFLEGWSSDGRSLYCFRDGEYSTVSLDGKVIAKNHLPREPEPATFLENVSFLPNTNSVVWLKNYYKNVKETQTSPGGYSYSSDFVRASIQSSEGEIATYGAPLNPDALLIPSPNGRYIAIAQSGRDTEQHLMVFDRHNISWSDLGEIIIHPNQDWYYIKPTWNPWFADSSKIVFATKTGIVTSSPDGKSKQVIVKPQETFGLPVPSPDGKNIAYLTFDPKPKKRRTDLKFWGGSTIWVIPSVANAKPMALTPKNIDTTFCLRWLNNNALVFDRIADEEFYGKARLWKVEF